MEIQNRKQKDGISKFLDINTDSKCKWTEFTKHTMTEYIKKKNQDPTKCCLQETHFNFKDIHIGSTWRDRKNIFRKWKTKESRGSYTFIKQCVLEVQTDNKTKSCNDKGISHQGNITIIKIYVYNRTHKYVKKILADLNG